METKMKNMLLRAKSERTKFSKSDEMLLNLIMQLKKYFSKRIVSVR